MAMKKMIVTVLVLFVAISAVNSQTGCPVYPPCSQVTVSQRYVYPDFNDCNKYWVCQSGVATRMSCPVGQELDLRDFSCQTPSTQIGLVRVTCGVLFTGLQGLQG